MLIDFIMNYDIVAKEGPIWHQNIVIHHRTIKILNVSPDYQRLPQFVGVLDYPPSSLLYHFSVFQFLRRVVAKLSSEVGCGEVTNPKLTVRERDRQSPTGLQCYHMCVYVEMGVVSFYSNTAICRAK